MVSNGKIVDRHDRPFSGNLEVGINGFDWKVPGTNNVKCNSFEPQNRGRVPSKYTSTWWACLECFWKDESK